MDVEEGGHSTTGMIQKVELEKVNENQWDWTPIQSRGFGHGGWTEAWPTPTDKDSKNWLSHVLRSESLLCTVLEGRMEGTRTRGRQSAMMIDWMKSNDVEYEHIQKRAHDREDWRHWRPGPVWQGRTLKRERKRERDSYDICWNFFFFSYACHEP